MVSSSESDSGSVSPSDLSNFDEAYNSISFKFLREAVRMGYLSVILPFFPTADEDAFKTNSSEVSRLFREMVRNRESLKSGSARVKQITKLLEAPVKSEEVQRPPKRKKRRNI